MPKTLRSNMEALRKAFENIPNDYKSIPFWSWNNFLDEDELVKQIDAMHAAGMGGFIMHARTGLKEEYLGEKWFSCIGACLKRARELGMNAWIYDENGWPSGFVGGKLLENEAFRARYLDYKTGAFDGEAFASFVKTAEGYRRVEKGGGASVYHNVYLRVSPANSDILNPAAVESFLEQTHEQYYARFSESFGRELMGFFTDEPQYYRWGTPYAPSAAAEFAKRGEDIRDGLVWLFVHDERGYVFRQKYYATLNKLYRENYYKKLYDWCEAHNCKLTGHSVEEGVLFAQMYGGAAVMPTYEYEHIPAVDWLGRDCGSALAPKQVSSAAAQLGKKYVLTETYGCAGFDVTPRELKSIGDFQYFNGVTTMCQHLYPYSMAGRGKTDHPPVFSPHGNWGDGFAVFNDYFNRLGYLVANTKEACDVAVLHPMRDIWLDYIRSEDYDSVKQTEDAFARLIETLTKRGITYQLIDETLLEKYGSAYGDTLTVGECDYKTLIVPEMRTLSTPTYRLLQKYTGDLLVWGELPRYLDGKLEPVALHSNITFDEITARRRVHFSCFDRHAFLTERTGSLGRFLFLKNNSRTEESRVRLEETQFASLDLQTLDLRAVGQEIVLRPCEGLILMQTEAVPAPKMEHVRDVSADFRVSGISPNYLVMDYAQLKTEGGTFGERRAVTGLFEDLLRADYKGRISVRQTFVLKDCMPLCLIMERGAAAAYVNGKEVVFERSDFDVEFVQADISQLVRAGENELVYSLEFYQHEGVCFALFDPAATESLRNCLYYDTSIETAYLKGNFVVGSDLSLSSPKEGLTLGSDLYKKGYPFFKGEYRLTGSVDWKGEGRAYLALEGRYHVAEVRVNGARVPLVLEERCELTQHLRKGRNTVEIIVKSSLRNLFGPHHYRPEPEPMGVSPYHFEFRGCWEKDKIPCDYTHAYQSVPFGVEKITFITEENDR